MLQEDQSSEELCLLILLPEEIGAGVERYSISYLPEVDKERRIKIRAGSKRWCVGKNILGDHKHKGFCQRRRDFVIASLKAPAVGTGVTDDLSWNE